MPILKSREITIKDFQEITVAIDTLDDIFSDFDPRPVQQRALSEDFLKEIKKFYREATPGKIEVVFLSPLELRNEIEKNQLGKAVISHLHQEFKLRSQDNKKVVRGLHRRGTIYIVSGMLLLLTLTLLGYRGILSKLSLEILGIVLMPIGWFGIWEGFSKWVDTPYQLKENIDMFERLAKAQYNFKFLGENKLISETPVKIVKPNPPEPEKK